MRKIVALVGSGLLAAVLSLPVLAYDEGMSIQTVDSFMIELVASGTDPMLKPEIEIKIADENTATLADTGTADFWEGSPSPPSVDLPIGKVSMYARVDYDSRFG